MRLRSLSFLIFLIPLSSCNPGFGISDLEVGVEERVLIPSADGVSFAYQGNDIWIENGYVRGMLSGTETEVTATDSKGKTATFKVTVPADNYIDVTNKSSSEETEGWLDDISYSKVNSLSEHADFPFGMDISMTKQVYDKGGQYYNEEGRAESVYRILKRHGVDYARFRLWNDPYNHFLDDEGNEVSVPYGGGICDLPTVLYMARSAKEAGMKVLLDFHFSDFWADPGKQVIPKAFADLTTSDQVGDALYDYVKETLLEFENQGALPDMVQLGNEITPGIFMSNPGPVNTALTGDNPYYISQATRAADAIRGSGGSINLYEYLSKAIQAVNEVDDSILKMIHLARGFSSSANIINFFLQFSGLDYEVIGLSAYSYYHFQSGFATLRTALSDISAAFPDKKITLAETAYGFTYAPYRNASHIFNRSGSITALEGYEVSPQGQSDFMTDLISSISSVGNGYGFFYWEGTWLPVMGAGWADEKSKCSWANQTFFSFSGHVLPSLAVYKEVLPD